VCSSDLLLYTQKIQDILAKTIDNLSLKKFDIKTSSDLHKYTKADLINDTETDVYRYKLIHTPSQTVYSSRPHKFQEGYKIFISTTDKYSVFIDNCGMTQSIAFIQLDNENQAKRICSQLLSPLYQFLNNACRYGNFNNIRILQKFPISTNDPYVEFGITPEEINYIESHL
jgi:hypothetical protein